MGSSVRFPRLFSVVLLTMCAATFAQNTKLEVPSSNPEENPGQPQNHHAVHAETDLKVRSRAFADGPTLCPCEEPVANVATCTRPGHYSAYKPAFWDSTPTSMSREPCRNTAVGHAVRELHLTGLVRRRLPGRNRDVARDFGVV
jgi:hypothetical protein